MSTQTLITDFNELNKSKVYCPLPWYSLTGQKSGKIGVCCMNELNEKESQLGHIEVDSFSSLWNCKKIKELRMRMLQGKKSDYCKSCYQRESKGLSSKRTRSIKYYGHLNKDIIKNTSSDGYYKGPIQYLDVKLSNLCNLACRMCSGHASSKRIALDRMLGITDTHYLNEPYDTENFWSDITRITGLHTIRFAGGEPLMNKNLYKTLILLIESGKAPKIHLLFSSNMTILPGINGNDALLKGEYKNIFEILNHFKSIKIWISIDGYKKSYEKIRIGSSWEMVRKNIEYLHEYSLKKEKYYIAFMPTIQIDNIYSFPKLYLFAKEKKIHIDINPIIVPEYLCITNLHPKDKQKINLIYKRIVTKYKNIFPEIKDDFNIILDFMNIHKTNMKMYALYLKNNKIMDDFSKQTKRISK